MTSNKVGEMSYSNITHERKKEKKMFRFYFAEIFHLFVLGMSALIGYTQMIRQLQLLRKCGQQDETSGDQFCKHFLHS